MSFRDITIQIILPFASPLKCQGASHCDAVQARNQHNATQCSHSCKTMTATLQERPKFLYTCMTTGRSANVDLQDIKILQGYHPYLSASAQPS